MSKNPGLRWSPRLRVDGNLGLWRKSALAHRCDLVCCIPDFLGHILRQQEHIWLVNPSFLDDFRPSPHKISISLEKNISSRISGHIFGFGYYGFLQGRLHMSGREGGRGGHGCSAVTRDQSSIRRCGGACIAALKSTGADHSRRNLQCCHLRFVRKSSIWSTWVSIIRSMGLPLF